MNGVVEATLLLFTVALLSTLVGSWAVAVIVDRGLPSWLLGSVAVLALAFGAGQAMAQEAWASYTLCGYEYGECTGAPPGSTVRFGAAGTDMFATRTKLDGVPMYCNVEAFGGDPAPSYEKVCAFGAAEVPGGGGGASSPAGGGSPFDLTAEQGQLIAFAIITVWAAAWAWVAAFRVLDTRGSDD